MKTLEEMTLEELKIAFFDLQEQITVYQAQIQMVANRIKEIRSPKQVEEKQEPSVE
jgi:uncharacterized coiled-coil protein SlyX